MTRTWITVLAALLGVATTTGTMAAQPDPALTQRVQGGGVTVDVT
jgi:hypothetical protein